MNLSAVLIAFATLLGLAHSQGCTNYLSFPNHTMCVYDARACNGSPGLKLIRSGGLTTAQKNEIVSIHNKLRAQLVAGTVRGQPKAAGMKTIVYDEELAMIAQRAADQCMFGHDKMRNVKRFLVGQNIYISARYPIETNQNPDMTAAAMAWWNEVYSPGFNPAKISPYVFDSGARQYTQMAWANTSTIGCGYVMFSGANNVWSFKHIFCNYGEAGNIRGNTMYVKATTAATG